ncbi:MAG: FadR family transcriptional regulator [Burkholderiales bacterium]|nr:FadR family transcriptional regulator [Burkholderiales bacterium]
MLSDNFAVTKETSVEVLPPARAAAQIHAGHALADATRGAAESAGASLNAVSRPLSLADEAHRQLLLQLDMALWKPGAKLPPEKALADSLGVSRPVLREALARLKADGRIESRQGAGAFVAERNKIAAFRLHTAPRSGATTHRDAHPVPAAEDADTAERELLELRQIVEAGAAELAAQRRTDADLMAIRNALGDMSAALSVRADGADADDRFHNAIAAATHNPQITRFVEFLGAQFSASRKVTWDHTGYAVGIAEVGHADHIAILEAIESSDAAAARVRAHAHVQRALDRVLARFATRAATSPSGV